jgi:potassium efflux system protein
MMTSMHFRKYALLLSICLFSVFLVQAQSGKPGKRPRRDRGYTQFSDSATATSAEYMLHLESSFQKLDSIQNESELRPEVIVNSKALKTNDSIVYFVDNSLRKYGRTLNLRSLELLKILVHDAQRDLRKQNEFFQKHYKDLDALRQQLRTMRRDTTFRQLIRDTVARKAFRPQLIALRAERRYTDSLLTTSLSAINTYKAEASATSILATQLMSQVNTRLSSAGREVFEKEIHYLWEPAPPGIENVPDGMSKFKGEQKALDLYFNHSVGNRFLRWIFGIAFLWWVMWNIRTLKRHNKLDTLERYNITYLLLHPVASAFAVIFTIAPLFDLDAPAGYMQLVQIFLMIALTFLFRTQWSKAMYYRWFGFVALFFAFVLFDRIAVPAFWQRCIILALNVTGIILALRFRNLLPEGMQLRRFIRYMAVLRFRRCSRPPLSMAPYKYSDYPCS